MVRCWGSVGRGRHAFLFIFCNTHLLRNQQQQSWKGEKACIGSRLCTGRGCHCEVLGICSTEVPCTSQSHLLQHSTRAQSATAGLEGYEGMHWKLQEGAHMVRCWGSAGRRCHVFHSFIFCNTQLLHDQDQQSWNSTKACIGSCRKGLTW